MLLAVLAFFASGVVVVLAGVALAGAADRIADATGIARAWIGAVLLAAATSLPELATDVAAVRMGADDLAAGDLFGSAVANMLILAVADLVVRKGRVLREAALDHALMAALAIGMTAGAAVLILVRPTTTIGGVGVGSLGLLVVYVLGARAAFLHGAAGGGADADPPARRDDLRRALVVFGVAALVVVVAAPTFAWAAGRIAEAAGVSTTWVGTWLVGTATSLPEVVATIAAVRMGAYSLAVGNLFGSNAIDMALFAALDAATPSRSFFAALSPTHAVTACFAIAMMALGLAASVYRAERRFALLEPSSVGMLVVYALAVAVGAYAAG